MVGRTPLGVDEIPPTPPVAGTGQALYERGWYKTFTDNTTEPFTITDLVGNQLSSSLLIDRIDTTPPQILSLTYDPSTTTNGEVTATLIVDKLIQRPIARSGASQGDIFTKTFTENIATQVTFTDLVGNQNYTGIEISRIDKGDLAGKLTYFPDTPTS
jgi:hypothetical protein